MLRLLVATQVHFPLEGAPAQVARERLEARVLPGVGDEVGRLAERLAAHLALVRLLPCNTETRRSALVFALAKESSSHREKGKRFFLQEPGD